MDDVIKRVTSLSPEKRALLKLRLKKKDKQPPSASRDNITQRIAKLSLVKQSLLKLRLTKKEATLPKSSPPQSENFSHRIAKLSLAKQTLLKLKLKKEQSVLPKPSGQQSGDFSQRVAKLSPIKQMLLQLRLKKAASSSPKSTTNVSPYDDLVTENIIQRVAKLSPIKQALLKLRLKTSPPKTLSPEEHKPHDIAQRVGRLSPIKQVLLELKLKGILDTETKTTTSTATISQRFANLSPIKQTLLKLKLTKDTSPDLTVIPTELVIEGLAEPHKVALITQSQIAEIVEADEPDWLADLPALDEALPIQDVIETEVQPGLPSLINNSPTIIQRPHEASPTAETDEIETTKKVPHSFLGVEAEPSLLDSDPTLEIPAWFSDTTSLDDLETPQWLGEDTLETDTQPIASQVETESAATAQIENLAPSGESSIDEATLLSPELSFEEPSRDAPITVETAPVGNVTGWLAVLKNADKAVVDMDSDTTETTGMLAGMNSLLPAAKVMLPSSEGQVLPANLNKAVQDFYNIATQPPQPVTLPSPLTGREKFIGNTLKAALLLLFVALIAIPFLPGTEKFVEGKQVAWTEPLHTSNEVLDSQRRQLRSEQLGAVDVQQPDSVALVSFDYSTATQGEMQPLAEAILGRLKGQGMRIIAISLEPEGTVIAQQTLDDMLAKRKAEEYGAKVVNLGYIPGQVAAVRALAANQTNLAEIADFKEGLTFAERTTWDDIQNMEQVDLIVTLADNPATARWWAEQLEIIPPAEDKERFLLAATSAGAGPFMQPYRASGQLDGLISGITGAAAIESGRNNFGPARQMIDSLSIAHLIIVIVIAVATIMAWMPSELPPPEPRQDESKSDTPLPQEEGEF